MHLFVFLALFLVIPYNAQAYLDPGSGSYLVQLIIAFAAGGLFFVRAQIARFFDFIRYRILRRSHKTPPTSEDKNVSSSGK